MAGTGVPIWKREAEYFEERIKKTREAWKNLRKSCTGEYLSASMQKMMVDPEKVGGTCRRGWERESFRRFVEANGAEEKNSLCSQVSDVAKVLGHLDIAKGLSEFYLQKQSTFQSLIS